MVPHGCRRIRLRASNADLLLVGHAAEVEAAAADGGEAIGARVQAHALVQRLPVRTCDAVAALTIALLGQRETVVLGGSRRRRTQE